MNEEIRAYLRRLTNKPHSLLFGGPAGSDKLEAAMEYGQSLGGEVYHFRTEGKLSMHSMEAMRRLIDEVMMPPLHAERKVFIIHDAERMLPSSANALLKTFEEPPEHSTIILLSDYPEKLLPTILSRCQRFYFRSPALPQHGTEVIELLQHPFSTYDEFSKKVKQLAEGFEQKRKESEEGLSEELWKGSKENLTASQQDALQKEIDGAASLRHYAAVYSYFDDILAYFRDLHLLKVGGNPAYLMLGQPEIKGQLLPLDDVQQAIVEAKTSMERSTSLNLVFENLLMKLKVFG